MNKEICNSCGKRQKRYRSAFSSWVCDNCKLETLDYFHPDAFIKIEIQEWWNCLSYDKKLELYLKDKLNKKD